MVKDIVLASSRSEAERTLSIWRMPPSAYNKLWWRVKDSTTEYPLLYSMCAHDEGPDGDFEVRNDQLPQLENEIDSLLSKAQSQEDGDLQELLARLRQLSMQSQESGLSIFGLAD
jgi:hypothetical protein